MAVYELRNFNYLSRNKAMGTPYGVYYIQLSLASDTSAFVGRESELYTCIGVGLSALYIVRPQFLFVTYLIISRYTKMQT